MSFFAELNGAPCSRARVSAPWTGAWVASVQPHDAANIPSGAAIVKVGQLDLHGTVDPIRTGVFAGSATVTVIGGAGAWARPVKSRKYHNDAGLRRTPIAVAAAREVGETLVVASAADPDSLGVDYPREAGPASRVLETLFPDVPWYVGADGVTRVGDRSTRDVSGKVTILDLEHTSRAATLSLEDDNVANVLPGCSILDTERLGAEPYVIHDVEVLVTGESVRATAWDRAGRDHVLVGALRSLMREADPRRTFLGLYRYRVYKMQGDRAELQIVKPRVGLPDVLPISIMPGLAGASAELTGGAVVLVQFIEGDPSLPVVTHASKKGDTGAIPQSLIIDSFGRLDIGESADVVNAGNADAVVLRNGEAIKITASGPVTAGPSGSVEIIGTIELAPGIVNAGPPPTGRSKVRA